ncbi:MAG TPA: mannonate dehydratase [Gaiellaceae bacterium]|nr:mannonate dehydratase [Gaiellaceae bacterium]
MLRLAEILLEPQPCEAWAQLRQVGVEEAVGVLPRGFVDWRSHASEKPWSYGPLALYRQQVEDAGFRLTVIEDNPPMDRLRLGLPGEDEELDAVLELITTMGRLGIEVWCYNWMAVVPWSRTSSVRPGRGGASVTAFDLALWKEGADAPEAPVAEERLWETLARFLERAVPVAEEAGVHLALHPDDPPLSPLRGIGRIVRSLDAYERVFELQPSPVNGMTLCQGNVALMTDDLPAAIRSFGQQRRIHFVHFRDVRGTPERFVETFVDEGPTDMTACIRAYREAGVDAPLRTDHSPTLSGDAAVVPGYPTLGRLHAVGYVQGLLAGTAGETRSQSPVLARNRSSA